MQFFLAALDIITYRSKQKTVLLRLVAGLVWPRLVVLQLKIFTKKNPKNPLRMGKFHPSSESIERDKQDGYPKEGGGNELYENLT